MRSQECRPEYLEPSEFVDSDAPSVRAFTERALTGMADAEPVQKAIRLFDAVRDGLRYDPFNIPITADAYRASHVALQSTAYCVPKAILLTAAFRAAGIPAAVGFADVRNHLNSPKLAELMDTDLFIYHGYTSVWLGGRMIKVTPAFNSELCERFGVKPLIFDGRNDALFHEFDTRNMRHMEYVRDRGWFVDPPIDTLLTDFRTTYPKLWQSAQARGAVRDEAFGTGR